MVRGYWSDDDNRLIIVRGHKGNNGATTVDCQIFEKDPQSPRFKATTQDYQPYPLPLDEEATVRISALHLSKSHYSGGYSIVFCRWTGDKNLEIESQVDVMLDDVGSKRSHAYRAKWTTNIQVTDKGFVTTGIGPIQYASLDDQHRPGTWQTLPVTDQDRLRLAVRLRQQDTVKDLLKKGVKPDSVPDVSLLSIAIRQDDPAMIKILLDGGADVNRVNGIPEPPLDLAMGTSDPQIFDLVMAAHPTASHDTSEDAYFDLYGGLGPISVQILDLKTNPKAGPVLDEFERRLKVLKSAGFDINTADDTTGNTVLMTAVEGRAALPVLQKLVSAGANPTQRNKAGKSPADVAADKELIDVLRFLYVDHSHAALLHDHEIPSGSPFVGSWGANDGMGALELKSDGSGMYASMFACNLAWKQSGDTASLDLIPMRGSWPNGVTLKGTAHLSSDGKKMELQLAKTGSTASVVELSKKNN